MFLLPAVASGTPTLNTIHHVDALTLLKALPAGSVDCVVTSPPYYALRDYGVSGQIGLEATPQQYIARMMEVFTEVYRILKPSGTVWVNLGDSYSSDSKGSGGPSAKQLSNTGSRYAVRKIVPVLPPKSLMMIPARFAIAMQDDGWILRNEIIWSKPNPMPESVTDRFTKSHEKIYFFSKSGEYWSDLEALKEPAIHALRKYTFNQPSKQARAINGKISGNEASDKVLSYAQRNMRDVWTIGYEPIAEDHYAAYPVEIPRRCILAGCPVGGIVLDMFMGSGTTAMTGRRLGRHFIGCDLNPDYVAMARRRLAQSDPYQSREVAPGLIQKSMFAN